MNFLSIAKNVPITMSLTSKRDTYRPSFTEWNKCAVKDLDKKCNTKYIFCMHYQPETIVNNEYKYEFQIFRRKTKVSEIWTVSMSMDEIYSSTLPITSNKQRNIQLIDAEEVKINNIFENDEIDAKNFTHFIFESVINKIIDYDRMLNNGVFYMDFTKPTLASKLKGFIMECDVFEHNRMKIVHETNNKDSRYCAIGIEFKDEDD